MTDLSDIAKAWLIAMNPTEEQKAIAEERRMVCKGTDQQERCFHYVLGFCNKCFCPIDKKVYVPNDKDGCPIGKWPKKFE